MEQNEETAGESISAELNDNYTQYIQMMSQLQMLDTFQANLETSYKNSLHEIDIQRYSIKAELRKVCPHRNVSVREFGDAETREKEIELICVDCGKWLDESERLTYEQQMILDELTSIDQDLGRYDE